MTDMSYPIYKSPLYRLRNRSHLAELLFLDKHYFNQLPEYTYTTFSRPKKNGGVRLFYNPSPELKQLQKRLLKLLQRIETPTYLISGKKGLSYVDNARVHKDNKHLYTMDITAFYESSDYILVKEMFQNEFMMSPDLASIITRIVTYKYRIPTGSPTSQMIIFWTYKNMFDEINALAQKNNCIFSLYVDDMTFSSQFPIAASIHKEVELILNKYNLHLKWSKDHVYRSRDTKLVTGVILNPKGELKVKNSIRKRIIDVYVQCKKEEYPSYEQISILAGLLSSAKQIEHGIFPEIERYVKSKMESF